MEVTPQTTIEELVDAIPASIDYLMEQGIRCIRCGEPIWGTLEEAAKQKGFSDEDIQGFVTALNALEEQPQPQDRSVFSAVDRTADSP